MNQSESLPLVSVLVPVYNVEDYIERCAHSVFKQTYRNLEIIFVDDGSTDGSIKVLEKVINDYPQLQGRVQIIYHETNKGLSAARNTLVDASMGEFVYHVDSDDWIEPNAIEKLVQKQMQSQADIVVGQWNVYEKDGRIHQAMSIGLDLEPKAYIGAYLSFKIYQSYWNRLIRKKLYVDNHILGDETLRREDWTPLMKLYYYAESTAFIDEIIYNYDKRRDNSIMNIEMNIPTVFEENFKYDNQIVSFFSDKEQSLSEKAACYPVIKTHRLIVACLSNGKTVPYFIALKKIKEKSNRNYWNVIGWNNPLVRFIESHWYVFRLKKFCGRLKRSFFN